MEMLREGERGQGLVEIGLLLFFVVLIGLVGLSIYSDGLGLLWAAKVGQAALAI